MKYFFSLTLLFFFFLNLRSQTIPSGRFYDWKHSGLIENLPPYSTTFNMQTLGADLTGSFPSDAIYLSIISQCTLTGQSYTILFPEGIYTFTNTINLKNNVKLEGSGASTRLIFTNTGICINAEGAINSAVNYSITETGTKFNAFLKSSANTSTIAINANEFIILKERAASLVTSNWAYNSVGQFFKIKKINADTLFLNHELRKNYGMTDTISLYKVNPIQNAGIKCIRVTRRNSSVNSNPTIQFLYAYNSFIDGVEIDSCFFSHVSLESSGNCEITGSYIHDAYEYGGGGRGYGVALQFNSTDHKIENNIFNHLRHSVLCQAGVNGNVVDYNYSINPFWTEPVLPPNSSGDLVLHGNYVYANLFEGNICQNIVIDNSHGINGPDNVFFRNRAESYGIFMNSGPASNNQIYIGNEITSTVSLEGQYLLAGSGHFEYGNKKQGVVTPIGTSSLLDISYCYDIQPTFLSGRGWPTIGIPNAYNIGTIPAESRNGNSIKSTCNPLAISIKENKENKDFDVYPNPTNHVINIVGLINTITSIDIVNVLGEKVLSSSATSILNLSMLSQGVYYLILNQKGNTTYVRKIILVH